MCPHCHDKRERIYCDHEIKKEAGTVVVTQESHCMACSRKFIDLYSLSHIATKVIKNGKFEDVVI